MRAWTAFLVFSGAGLTGPRSLRSATGRAVVSVAQSWCFSECFEAYCAYCECFLCVLCCCVSARIASLVLSSARLDGPPRSLRVTARAIASVTGLIFLVLEKGCSGDREFLRVIGFSESRAMRRVSVGRRQRVAVSSARAAAPVGRITIENDDQHGRRGQFDGCLVRASLHEIEEEKG